MATPSIPSIGAVGVSRDQLTKGKYGVCYFDGFGEVTVYARENIPARVKVLVVNQENKRSEVVDARVQEGKLKAWNATCIFTLGAGAFYDPGIDVNGEGRLESLAICIAGANTTAETTEIRIYQDGEYSASLVFTMADLYILGGNYAPTINPKGGLTVRDASGKNYNGFINPNLEFKTRCFISIKNGDPLASAGVSLVAIFALKGTETDILIKTSGTTRSGGDTTNKGVITVDTTKPHVVVAGSGAGGRAVMT